MSLKKSNNFAVATVLGGYTSTNTFIVVNTTSGSLFSTASTNSSYNVVWWNWTSYKDPADDPNKEICLARKYNTNSFYLNRGQEGTSASSKNTAGKTYKIQQDFSKVEKDEVENYLYPIGAVVPMPNTASYSKWVICDGSAISKTNTEYADLYSLIGTRFNTNGTSSSKFLLPLLQYQVVMHVNASDTSSTYPKSSIGDVSGLPWHQLSLTELPAHGDGHVASVTNGFVYWTPPPSGPPTVAVASITTTSSGFIDPAPPHNNMQPYCIFQYYIKYKK